MSLGRTDEHALKSLHVYMRKYNSSGSAGQGSAILSHLNSFML